MVLNTFKDRRLTKVSASGHHLFSGMVILKYETWYTTLYQAILELQAP